MINAVKDVMNANQDLINEKGVGLKAGQSTLTYGMPNKLMPF
ncbi:MAG: hypothetical protein ACI8WB_002187 [Phenylobacterium sp.]|jgi:hypothetical protein